MSDNYQISGPRSTDPSSGLGPDRAAEPAGSSVLPMDPFRIADRLIRHLWWIGVIALLSAIAVTVALPKQDTFSVVLRFVLRDAFLGVSTERPTSPSRGPVLSPAVSASIASAWAHPEVVSSVAAKLQQTQGESVLARGIEVIEDKDQTVSSDVIQVGITSEVGRDHCVSFANAYAAAVVDFVKGIQAREFRDLVGYYNAALAATDRDLLDVDTELKTFLQEVKLFDYDRETDAFLAHRGQLDRDFQTARIDAEAVDLKIQSLVNQVLELKQGEIDNLLVRYSEQHPLVEERKALFNVLKHQLSRLQTAAVPDIDGGSPAVNGLIMQIVNLRVSKVALVKQAEELNLVRDRVNDKLVGISARSMDYGKIKSRLQSLQTSRSLLMGRLREADLAEKNAIGYVRLIAPPSLGQVKFRPGWLNPLVVGLVAGVVVFALAAGLIVLREILDDHVVTRADLARATRLPVLASIPKLDAKTPAEREEAGVRTWAYLSRQLGNSDGKLQGCCGLIASTAGEGCTTTLQLLAAAVRQRGIPCLVISLHPEATSGVSGQTEESAQGRRWLENALAVGPSLNAQAPVHSPPKSWDWNPERLEAWAAAVQKLHQLGSGLVLVELLPMTSKDATLLAAALPRVLWLSSSGTPRQETLRGHLELLRFAGVRIVGAMLNREPKSWCRTRIARWLPISCLMAGLLALPANAAAQPDDTNATPVSVPVANKSVAGTNQFLSLVAPSQRAPWQQKLTLGPGDVLSLSVYGESSLARGEVAVGPDGRLSYLEATDVMASGLTIDELRVAIQDKLKAFYRAPRVMISPVAFHSKKFFLLGAVNQRGVYTLDRPMTLVEAVAQAKGLSSAALTDNQIIELVDFSRSFLIRGGNQVEVDFERLFGEGDLSQNLALEPEDFLYFAPTARDEVYVLGAVSTPGVSPYTPQLTLVGALASRGGYAGGAYLQRVLVVRGSLRRPETYVVNVQEILRGKSPDFRLQRKDIIYVSSNPWAIVTQVLGIAIQNYTYGVAVAWTGENITRRLIDTKPYIKGL